MAELERRGCQQESETKTETEQPGGGLMSLLSWRWLLDRDLDFITHIVMGDGILGPCGTGS